MNQPASFARMLTPISILRYAWWRLRGRGFTVQLQLRNGVRLFVRPRAAGNNDLGVAYEIFAHQYYACPRPLPADAIRLVVDLGANVGFSCLYWLSSFPQSGLVAVEPHPTHHAQCRLNLAANDMLGRVQLHQAAAGAAPGRMTLSDAGTSSTIMQDDADGIPVEMLDVFALLAGRQVDLMKLDIEGGEYAILEDPRFAALHVPYLVMEWHGGPAERGWCLSRLDALDYETLELFDNGSHGMLWAFRRKPALAG